VRVRRSAGQGRSGPEDNLEAFAVLLVVEGHRLQVQAALVPEGRVQAAALDGQLVDQVLDRGGGVTA
jgi:hypothetical protein